MAVDYTADLNLYQLIGGIYSALPVTHLLRPGNGRLHRLSRRRPR
jgi:hypothetical protein